MEAAPQFTPENITVIFKEGTSSLRGNCFNAAGAMFRLCLDLVTKSLLPDSCADKDSKKKLWNRLEWLFNEQYLPIDLKDLAECIRQDGNDGAHEGTLTKVDAEDLLDFTRLLLERIYTEPTRIKEAQARRTSRRSQ